jgi:hypothetical protein
MAETNPELAAVLDAEGKGSPPLMNAQWRPRSLNNESKTP